jgi:hypothetical protein
MDKHSSALMATGGVLVPAGGALMAVGHATTWASAWFCGGIACAGPGVLLALLGLFAHFRASRKKPSTEQDKPVVGLGAGVLAAPIQPLIYKILQDTRFDPWGPCRIAILQIEIENTTDRDISISGWQFTCDDEGRPHWDYQVTNDQRMKVVQEITNRQNASGYGALEEITHIAARSRASGCWLAPVARNPAGGTPECSITFEDDMGNKYVVKQPRREPRTYEGP